MSTLYERLAQLCTERGIKGARMCSDLGLSKSLMTDLKMGRKKGVSAETAQKLASYFGVTVGYLLGEEAEKAPTESGKRNVTEEDIQFALFGGSDEITEKMYDEVKKFADFLKQREGYKGK